MKPHFQNLSIDCWQHTRLGISEVSFCLHHSSVELGQPLLAALEELLTQPLPVQRTLSLRPSNRKQSLTTIRLRLVDPRDNLQVMHIHSAENALIIEMTSKGHELVRQAISTWLSGSEDFGISPLRAKLKKSDYGALDKASAELWFWGPDWMP